MKEKTSMTQLHSTQRRAIEYDVNINPARCGCRSGCILDTGARWRNLANTTDPSVCGCDAALRQINPKFGLLTTFKC